MLSSILVIVPFLSFINAANDWKAPCVKGQCSYDLPNGPSSGTMTIWGSEDAISDITTAADWQILGCDPAALSQNIRLVCMNDDSNSLCGHLYQNNGAVNKIVRLPENCGKNAFARIAKSWVPEDQSIPTSIKARLVRRNSSPPVVKALAIDTNFDGLESSTTGTVNFAIEGGNVPGAATNIQIPGSRRGGRARRGLFGDFGKGIKSKFNDITSDVGGIATKAVGEVTSAFGDATSAIASIETVVASKVQSAGQVIQSATSIDKNKTFNLDPISFSPHANLFNTSVGCGPVTGKLSVDIDATGKAQPNITISVRGSLGPKFGISTFKVVTDMNADVTGTLTLSAELTGHVDSGKIPVFSAGIPGLDFPGVLEIGPTFDLNAEFVGDVDLTMDIAVGLNYVVNNARLTFPPDGSATDSNAFTVGDTRVTKTQCQPQHQSNGNTNITVHLIPTLNLGLSALAGKFKADLFVALDASAALVLSLDASAKITQPIVTDSAAPSVISSIDASTASSVASADTATSSSVASVDVATSASVSSVDIATSSSVSGVDVITSATVSTANATATGSPTPAPVAGSDVATKRDVSTSFGGCVNVNGGIDVDAGATGDFFGLFDGTKSVNLFSKKFKIFEKCFGDKANATGAETRRSMRRVSRRNPFSCPAPGLSPPAAIADETVSASKITKA
ncbi:hypothetical protein C8R43DRAFT_1159303 [Mycena crocata]|nr:hypothetical protein C8R43DRAFT_1159303 [Mycena crocata]